MASFFVMIANGGNMNTEEIIGQIDIEISKLQQARSLLLGVEAPLKRGPGRPASKGGGMSGGGGKAKPTKRRLSPEGRKKIADAVKKRWAERKKTLEAVKKAVPAKAVAAKKVAAKKSAN
jgi:hypothetical protein